MYAKTLYFFIIFSLFTAFPAVFDLDHFLGLRSAEGDEALHKYLLLYQHKAVNQDTIYMTARFYAVDRGAYNDAIEILECEGENLTPLGRNLLAWCQEQMGQYEPALSNYDAAYTGLKLSKQPLSVSIDSSKTAVTDYNFFPAVNRIALLYKLKRYIEAGRYITAVRERYRDAHLLSLLSAVLLFRSYRFDMGEMMLNLSAMQEEFSYDRSDYYYFFGLIHEDSRDYKKALDYFRYARSLDPTAEEIRYKIEYLEDSLKDQERTTDPYFISEAEKKKYRLGTWGMEEELFLTERQLGHKLDTVIKLIKDEKYNIAYYELGELRKKNSLLFTKDCLYYMAVCSRHLGRPLDAREHLVKAAGISGGRRVGEAEIRHLSEIIEKIISENTQKLKTREKHSRENPIEEQLSYFFERIPLDFLLPQPDSVLEAYRLEDIPDEKLPGYEVKDSSAPEVKPPPRAVISPLTGRYARTIVSQVDGATISVEKNSYREGSLVRKEIFDGSRKLLGVYNYDEPVSLPVEFDTDRYRGLERNGSSLLLTEKDRKGQLIRNTRIGRGIISADNYGISGELTSKVTIRDNEQLVRYFHKGKPVLFEMTEMNGKAPVISRTYDADNMLLHEVRYDYGPDNDLQKESHYSSEGTLLERYIYTWYNEEESPR